MKIFKQDSDWHVHDYQTGDYLGEVFAYEDYCQIWIKSPAEVPGYLQQQIKFGFAVVNDKGYIVIPNKEYESITEFQK